MMGEGNRNKVFFLSFLDQIFLQPLDSFHEMIVFRSFTEIKGTVPKKLHSNNPSISSRTGPNDFGKKFNLLVPWYI